MLDFYATIILVAVTVVNVNAVVSAVPVDRLRRLVLAAAAGLWIGLVAASASVGWIAVDRPFPMIGLFFAFPLVATGLLAAFSPAVRTALLSLPAPLLIGLNISRVFGVLFLLLAMQGRLGGPFPISAGWGDIITGLLAVPVMLVVARGAADSVLPSWWNAFGALDLVVAVALGLVSADGSPLQLIHAVSGPTPLTALPYVFIPTVLVPFYLITHAILFVQLRRNARIALAQV